MENIAEPRPESFKIACTQYPEIFAIDKSACKQYFKQFGKVLRIVYKQRAREIIVEYTNKEAYLSALSAPSEYAGQPFKLEIFESRGQPIPPTKESSFTKKKLKDKIVTKHKLGSHVKKSSISYVDNDEVNEELVAMGGGPANIQNVIDLTGLEEPEATIPSQKVPRLKRVWKKKEAALPVQLTSMKSATLRKKNSPGLSKKPLKEKLKILSGEQMELLKTIKSQAYSVDEKYKVLDARDKLLRLIGKRLLQKTTPTVGTCPDMCPEKERLLREIQHQVSMYEQEEGSSKHTMNHSRAVKQYSRSSADQEAPLPHELRPVSVLQLTMNYLMYHIMDLCERDPEVNIGEWFHFLWDRTRGIRKDITQQALCCQLSVELVEQCARFHIHCSARLMGEDPAVFDQKINTENLTKCLQTLKYMYHDLEVKGEMCANEAEFRAYIILLNLSDGNFMWEVQELRKDIQRSREVRFAIQIYSAFDKRNYVKFFKLIRSTTYLNACILMRYFVQVRVQAIETLTKCFTPPKSMSLYPVNELTQSLLFDDIEATVDFMKAYGLSVNSSGHHFVIERSSFFLPEYSYVLERSRCVEEKRTDSVGAIVSGREISVEAYMEMQQYKVHSSFSSEGYLVKDEIFKEIELGIEERLLEDEPDSRESTPERKNVVMNIFATKAQTQRIIKEEKNIFGAPPASNSGQPVSNIFGQTNVKMPSVIGHSKQEPNRFQSGAAFPQQYDNVDSSNPPTSEHGFESAKQANYDSPSKKRLFATDFGKNERPVGHTVESSKSIFSLPTAAPAKGGFAFTLTNSAASNIFASDFKPLSADTQEKEELAALEQERSRLQAEIRKEEAEEEEVKRRQEEIRRKNEEAAIKRRLEAEMMKREEMEKRRREEEKARVEHERRLERERIERERRIEEERVREEAEKRRAEERRQREKEEQERFERLRKQEEERLRDMEIRRQVQSVLNNMIETVDLEIRRESLERIRENIKRRSVIKIYKRWRFIASRRTRKRKALDCMPVFVHAKSVDDCAQDLRFPSQDLTLSNIKRYRLGKPWNVPSKPEPPVCKLNLFHLTYSSLRRRLSELKEKWRQHLYWKVTVSIPDIDEMDVGLNKLEETLKSYIDWSVDSNGNVVYVERHKTVTYCVEKQQGLQHVNSCDSNAFVFVAKSFNDTLQQRIAHNFVKFGVYVKLPIVLVLEDASKSEEYLESLRKCGIVSDFLIYSCSLNAQILPSIINNALIFLSKGVQQYPPLEMDTLYSFLLVNLCSEIWKKASGYTKWNHEYNMCMRDPNIVINLYNQGLQLLAEIVTDKKCKEHLRFPEIFRQYLPDKLPTTLPCDYRYFPSFWSSSTYENHLKSILLRLKLPKFMEKWPPEDESELIDSISGYCSQIFTNPETHTVALLTILRDRYMDVTFDMITWTEAIQYIAQEKLKSENFALPDDCFSDDIIDTCVVVYDVNALNEYRCSEWFYRNNSLIEGYKKVVANKLERENKDILDSVMQKRKRALESYVEPDDILSVIHRAEELLKSPKSRRLDERTRLNDMDKSVRDLEDSIRVVKRMDDLKLLERFLEN